MASARLGGSPAYIAWKLNSRRSRSSRNRSATTGPSRRNPPMRTSRAAARGEDTRSSGESKFRSMKCGISSS